MVIETDDEKSMIPVISARNMDEIKKHQGILSLVWLFDAECHHCFPQ